MVVAKKRWIAEIQHKPCELFDEGEGAHHVPDEPEYQQLVERIIIRSIQNSGKFYR